MGFFVRKSISVGPFRFNLSGTGIGVSTGVPGLRVGTGPKGTYIHMGRDGFYYRQKINLSPVSQNDRCKNEIIVSQPTNHTHGPMMLVGTQSIDDTCNTSSMAILNEIQEKSNTVTWWQALALFSLLGFTGVCMSELTDAFKVFSFFIFSVPVVLLHQIENWRKTVVLMYDLDEKHEASFAKLFDAIRLLSSSGGKWRVIAAGDVLDRKYHAGASYLVNRVNLEIQVTEPAFIKTNVPIQKISFGKIDLYFMPDGVLVYSDSGRITAIDYDSLLIDHSQTRFTENETVPNDATIIGSTWRYINKDGGPDRRFSNNNMIPVCLYEELKISSKNGIDETILISKNGLSKQFKKAVNDISEAIKESAAAERSRIANEMSKRQNETSQMNNEPGDNCDSDAKDLPKLDPFDVLFQSVCCVMASDGLASRLEKEAILNVMKKVKSNWSDELIAKKIKGFLIDIELIGYNEILNRSIQNISVFKKIGREHVVINAMNLVINADEKIDPREVAISEKFKQALA